jgi:hypothetical protein
MKPEANLKRNGLKNKKKIVSSPTPAPLS